MAWLVLGLYALVLTLATPLYLWRVWSRGQQEPLYRAVWWQRLGWYDVAYRQQWQARHQGADGQVAGDGPVVWVHAVSLGEARAAAPLVHALRQHIPGMRLLLTHGTATGRDAGRALLQTAQGDMQTWLPYDTPGLHVALGGLQQCLPGVAAGGGAMGEQQAHARDVQAQGLHQRGCSTGQTSVSMSTPTAGRCWRKKRRVAPGVS